MDYRVLTSPVVGITIGSAVGGMIQRGEGVLVHEPTCVVLHAQTDELIATGQEAATMMGKVPSQYRFVRVAQRGMIANELAAQLMLQEWKQKAKLSMLSELIRPTVTMAVPVYFDQVHAKATSRILATVGFGNCLYIPSAVATLLAAGQSAPQTTALVIDIGADHSEAAIVSHRNVIASVSSEKGSWDLIRTIRQFFFEELHIEANEQEIEQLLMTFDIHSDASAKTYVIRGKHSGNSMMSSQKVTQKQLYPLIYGWLLERVQMVQTMLSATDTLLLKELSEQGCMLTGAISQMKGIDELFRTTLHIDILPVARPQYAPLLGLGKIMEQPDEIHTVILHF